MPTKLEVFEGSVSHLSYMSLKWGIGITGLMRDKLGTVLV